MLYFYIPIVILVTSNIVLFVVTSLSLYGHLKRRRRRRRTSQGQFVVPALAGKKPIIRRHSSNNQVQEVNKAKERLQIQLKLSVVMGLSWVFEPISWVVDSSSGMPGSCWIWLASDLVNMLQEKLLDVRIH